MNKVYVSDSPHIRGARTTKGIMLDVCIALLPACIMGCVYFGWKALLILALSCVGAVGSEIVYNLILRKNIKAILRNFDFTSLVSGILLGMCLSSNVPWYVPVISSIFMIVVVKMLFGGTGKNIVNPAITGRVFAFIAFQSVMISGWAVPNIGAIVATDASVVTSGATPLTAMLSDGVDNMGISLIDLFLGTGVTGCIGETCKLALLAGGIYLVCRKVINWKWPVIYIGVTGLMSVALNGFDFAYFLPSILSGGLFLGAIFMATDYVTSPFTDKGRYVYYIALGIVTALLRKYTRIEVVSFAILLMNLFVPLINAHIRPRIFGAPTLLEKIKAKVAAIKSKKQADKEVQK
ncbi:MAG: RnfABCDGE type electron transport complex subunit D [Christensenellales bacterium]